MIDLDVFGIDGESGGREERRLTCYVGVEYVPGQSISGYEH